MPVVQGSPSETESGTSPLTYVPGPWVALASAHDPAGDVLMLADLAPDNPVVTACWAVAQHGATLDALLGVILREGLRSVPSFVLAARTGEGVRVLVSGQARAYVSVPGQSTQTLGAAGEPTWLERTVPGADGVRLAADLPDAAAGGATSLPTRGGIVLAAEICAGQVTGGVEHPAAAAAADPSQTAEAPVEPVQPAVASPSLIDSMPFASPTPTGPPASSPPAPHDGEQPANEPTGTPLDVAAANAATVAELPVAAPPRSEPSSRAGGDPAAAPTLLAVACPNGHLGPPHSGVCRVCAAPIAPQNPFDVARPPLGILNMSTGDMVPLDRDVVLGRSPSSDEADPVARPHLVQLASPGNDISRNHVRVSLEGWHVLVTDLDSTNGTVITVPNQAPVRLRPNDAFTIVNGTMINIADEVNVRYEIPG